MINAMSIGKNDVDLILSEVQDRIDLNSWESDFVESLIKRIENSEALTEKQLEKLESIYERDEKL